jgi:predicted nucleic acid-binding protein
MHTMPASGDTRIFLDTNIFLYAAGGEHPLKAPCANIVTRVGNDDLGAVTSSEVVQEILYVLSRRKLMAEGVQLAAEVMDMFPDLLPVTGADMLHTCRILHNHPGLPVRDAVHCSVMSARGITRIVTADIHFDQIPGIQRIDPSTGPV